jgi:deoxyribodipyrimidine photo-lyase
MAVAGERVRVVNGAPVRPGRELVLYWMIANRRVRWNQALERAVALAREHGKPLVVLEPLSCSYPHASDRLHAFVMAGMAENARRLAGRPVLYHPWLERAPGEGRGLLAALAARAVAVVTDDWPAFFLPRAVAAAGAALDVRLEAVDASTVLPFRQPGRAFTTAHLLRRHLQRHLPGWLSDRPAPDPLARVRLPRLEALPREVTRRWPAAGAAELARPGPLLATLPVDHRVAPCGEGGSAAAEARLARFVDEGLPRYAEARSAPDLDGASGLSPWLHFGHLSAQQVVHAVLAAEGWVPTRLSQRTDGAREGWWGASRHAEAFLDQVVTWRELGFGWAAFREDHLSLASLPAWAQATLARHAPDPRLHRYHLAELEAAATHDPLWNASQRQLRREGIIHNTLRMLWGKKILEWSASPQEALASMLHLNDRWALDGRDPNSATGILWCLGRHDRPWGPERPVFGTVRFMSSQNTARKHPVKRYLERFGPAADGEARGQLERLPARGGRRAR